MNDARLIVIDKNVALDHGRIRNEDIRNRYGIAPIVKKCGHIISANENWLREIGLNIEVNGKGPKG